MIRPYSSVLLWGLLFFAPYLAAGEQRCHKDDDCEKHLSCHLGYCVAKDCITRELRDASAMFDPLEYTNMIFAEAGVSKRDIIMARVQNPKPEDFVVAAPIVAMRETIQAHSNELIGFAEIMRYCSSGEGREDEIVEEMEKELGHGRRRVEEGREGSGLGSWVGSIIGAITGIFDRPENGDEIPSAEIQESDGVPSAAPSLSSSPSASSSPSFAPSVSLAPTDEPSVAPSYSVQQKIYVGIHAEGGLLMDSSCSYLFPANNRTSDPDAISDQYVRNCLGAEFGIGGEVALIAMFANLRENNQIVGVSLVAEFADVGLGGHFGAGVGVFTEGEGTQDGNEALHYEMTVGAGLGFSIFGTSLCRTVEVSDGIDV